MTSQEDLFNRGIHVTCDCGHMFEAPESMKGGIVNCPKCQKIVNVPGGPEGLFYLLLFTAIAVVIGISVFFFTVNLNAGFISLVIGAIIIVIGVIAS